MKQIEQDQMLVLAVMRFAGAKFHSMFWILEKYRDACNKGNKEHANVCASILRRKLVEHAVQTRSSGNQNT